MTSTPITSPAVTAVLAGLQQARGWQEDFYRDLHEHPELSHQETRTAARVADRLRQAGYEVHEGIGGTGVVGILRNGNGPTVLMRADMDALPVREETGLDYASTATADASGQPVPVMHACGHDVHVTCLAGAAHLLAQAVDQWAGTVVALFQPAEETGDGARAMVQDHLADVLPTPTVALAQHVLAFPAGQVGTRPGPVLSAADSLRITIHGRGAHGSMPQAAVDPVVIASAVVLRLQTIVSRELRPGEPAVVTVGSVQAGTKSNVIPDSATLLVNIRTYRESTRATILEAITRIVTAECDAGGSPTPPQFEPYEHYPLTSNDPDVTTRVATAFSAHFGQRAITLPLQSASEDFSDLPAALGTPYTYWGIGGADPDAYAAAERAGRVDHDIPVNHSAGFAPLIQPTLDTGTQALAVAALAWLTSHRDG
jgi:amidohydrolase